MGNSTSNAANTNNHNSHLRPSSRRYDSPTRRTQSPSSRGGSPVPSSNRVHKSLRSKKKSLELPDLASLALTPATSPGASPHAGYRRPRASSPIPIPVSPRTQAPSFRVQNNFASAAQLALQQNGRGSRYRSYLSSAHPSTHSFISGDQEQGSPPHQEPQTHEFVPEVVHSTIPLALPKAEGEIGQRPEHVTVTIKWRGGGKSVVLARAGDDYWKGRQPMEYE
ncbi:carbohydrate-binding module family 48 protein [Phanerochaete carnosa HHB-10118-sp]|uniref:Carbohydrate-binding module family 48 protein n=1 Tax=Phanerochaete carnosa (strain HHB-10118-sp) TaxID=650164 RepID=K5WNM3_PHACS|nr:carbohydrate-binding module family 48 protein [Phanerochaete carnosa HHB-10118-sp]EKM51912.1 carbohydrate-binding module family 48 protein [Phanerochaete carnosa HHB-10118-sp]